MCSCILSQSRCSITPMGDEHLHNNASSARNRSVVMSGIDWSIFKDAEEDTFGWLLRNNAVGDTSSPEVVSSVTENVEILPLDDVEMDRTMTSALTYQEIISKRVDGDSAATADRIQGDPLALGDAQSNAETLQRQCSSPSQSLGSNLLLVDNSNSGVGKSCGKLEDSLNEGVQERGHGKQDVRIQTQTAAIIASSSGEKMTESTATSSEESLFARTEGGRRNSKADDSSYSAKNTRPLKRQKGGTALKDSNLGEDFEKKKLRRVKNLLSVREFRKRKMKQQEQNEARLRRLEAENMDLRIRLKIGKEAILSEQREKKQIKEQMREMLQRNANEHEIAQFLNMYKVTYSDYGPKRREKLHFHLSRIQELLLPTQVTKLSLYSVEQGVNMLERDKSPDSVSGSATVSKSLWGILADELEVSDDQQRQILERRAAIRKVRDDLNHTLNIVKKLKEVTDEKNTALEAQVAQLQQILTPSQATKFIIWVKENPAFMYMLDKLVNSTLEKNSNS